MVSLVAVKGVGGQVTVARSKRRARFSTNRKATAMKVKESNRKNKGKHESNGTLDKQAFASSLDRSTQAPDNERENCDAMAHEGIDIDRVQDQAVALAYLLYVRRIEGNGNQQQFFERSNAERKRTYPSIVLFQSG
jgi:hypothetical protein